MRSLLRCRWLVICLLFLPFIVVADEVDSIEVHNKPFFSLPEAKYTYFIYSPFTHHFSSSDDHKYVWLLGLENENNSGRLTGITIFSNSFGQPSMYIYPFGGVFRNILNSNGLFIKWSAGLIYGYKKPYEDKVPFNHNGFSPGFIPAIGYQGPKISAQINVLNDAGLMFQLNWSLKTKSF